LKNRHHWSNINNNKRRIADDSIVLGSFRY
jgi:hypothetical protein